MNRRSLFRSALAVVFSAPVAAAAVKLSPQRMAFTVTRVPMQNGARIDFVGRADDAPWVGMDVEPRKGWKFVVFDGEQHYSEVKAHSHNITPQFNDCAWSRAFNSRS